jgi:hypothetical protein
VLEPPSDLLTQRLREELLCTPSDLRRARRRVRRLARDLPAFDSVWIDALIQDGRITPYQARLLESDAAASLRIGPYILLDELGRGARSRTVLACNATDGERIVVKQVFVPLEQRAAVQERSRELMARSSGLRHPCLNGPLDVAADDDSLLLVSRYVAGLPLADLLVRRGRFPADVVTAMARQLVDGLRIWHRSGLVHGDIRRSHVRITERGIAVLVEAGVRTLMPGDITIYAPLAEEAYDGVAPELIGIARTATPATDWYALGCVLWQLLAGRPPFPMADPLAKLAAHQTRAIDDVREWAPETPIELAELIRGLTDVDPERRLAEVEQFATRSGPPAARDRRTIAAFRRAFDSAVPHLRSSRPANSYRWPLALGAGCLSAAIAAVLADAGLRAELMSLAASWTHSARDDAGGSAASDLIPLPPPSPDGTIVLTESGPYAAATIRFPGTLTLRAAEGACPTLLIRDQPLRIAAEHWKCEGVSFRCDRLFRAAPPSTVLVDVVARRITWQHCGIELGDPLPKSADVALTGVAWRPIESSASGTAPQLQLQNCLLHGMGTMVAVAAPATVRLENVLHLGRGPLMSVSSALLLDMQQVTLRNSGPLVQIRAAEPTSLPRVAIVAEDCVLQPRTGHAVLEYLTAAPPALSADALTWSGEGSILSPGGALVQWVGAANQREEITAEAGAFDGLIVGQVQFAGLTSIDPADSMVTAADTPRRSPEPPGIIARLLGACSAAKSELSHIPNDAQ